MARPLRHPVKDGWYHVFGRGWERRRIFSDERDREHFLELLAGLQDKHRIVVHAFVLMENHHHLLLQTPDANLSQGMQWFNTSYSTWFNARHKRVGSLWQGRYRDVLIENSSWASVLSYYLHLNPLRIGALGLDKRGRVLEGWGYRTPERSAVTERLRRLREYRWSSYRHYAGYSKAPDWLCTAALLGRADGDPGQARAAYRKQVRRLLAQGVEPDQVERLRDAVAIGSASFAAKIRAAVPGDLEVDGRRDLRRRCSEPEIREAVCRLREQKWSQFAHGRGDWGRSLYAWAMRRYAGATLREAGQHVGGMKPSAVAMMLERLDARAATDPQLRARQQRLIGVLEAESEK